MKRVIIFFSTMLMSFGISAQVSIKPHIGMNLSVLSSDVIDYEDPGFRLGFMGGIGVKVGEDFYFEPGLQWTYNTFELVHESDESLDHLSIIRGLRVPVLVGFQFGKNEDFLRFRIFAGPSATFILGVNDENNNAGVPNKNDINSVIWSGNAGIGLDVWFLYIELGYEFGLSNYYSNTRDYGDGKQIVSWLTVGANLFGR